MAEIVATVAGVVSAVINVGKCFGRPFMTLYSYKTNFSKLENDVGRLKVARDEVKDKVDAAENNVEKIKQPVTDWQKKANSIIVEAEELIGEKANNKCFNLITCYKNSRKASKKAKVLTDLLQEKETLGEVSLPVRTYENIRLTNKDYEEFESRMSTLKDVLKALDDGEVGIIGVYGMGGIGKTTLVKEVGKQAKKRQLFDEVVFTEVSENPDTNKIQDELANQLGLNFDQGVERASKLYARLKKDKKILVILDNIWKNLSLETVGIPSGADRGGCKLLMTARDVNVLSRMDSESNFPLGILNEEEAWSLFRKMAGDVVDQKSKLNSLPNDVCKECRGLPIFITTIARALRNKRRRADWDDALRELRKPSPLNFTGLLEEEYSKIALSYYYLKGDELKKVFLIASLMVNNSSILDLLKYVMGLEILEGVNLTMEQARNRVDKLVGDLKDSCLLLDSSTNERFSMHDIVRIVALTIACKEEHVFTEGNDVGKEWTNKDELRKCTKISLASSKVISEQWPEGLDCPVLEFFYMNMMGSSFKIPEKFFTGLPKSKVLNLSGLSLLPSSLGLLTNLQTLSLDNSNIQDVVVIGELKRLKILSLRYSTIKQLPEEIGKLTQLRLLDLSNCWALKNIAPNVISSLSQLEELYMSGCDVLWQVEGLSVERRNASLDELKHLPHLTTLEIDIRDDKILPKGLFSTNLERYKISIGPEWSRYNRPYICGDHGRSMRIDSFMLNERETLRTLRLKLNSFIWTDELQRFKNVELLCLDRLNGIKDDLYELDKEGFSQLKHLHVHNNPNLLHIVDSTKCISLDSFPAFPILESLILFYLIQLEKICYGEPTTKSFYNLKFIEVKSCAKLENIFSFSNASRSLPKLQRIKVEDCQNMKEIFAVERENNVNNNEEIDHEIKFSRLRFLTLGSLKSLASFYSGLKTPPTLQTRQKELTINLQSNNTLMPLFSEKVIFPNLEALELKAINSQMIWDSQLPPMSDCYQHLTRLIINDFGKLKYLFPSSMVKNFEQLQHLEISYCDELKEIIPKEEGVEAPPTFIFPRVEFLNLGKLPELTTFYPGTHTSEWPKLKKLWVYRCDKLHIFTSQYKVVFPNLEHVNLQAINSQMIWDSQLPPMSDCYHNLTRLIVSDIGKLKYVFPSSMVKSFKQLQHIEISSCKELKEIVTKEEGAEALPTFIFPRVEFLELGNLSELTTFYPGIHTSEWPKLKNLKVYSCDKLQMSTSQCKIVFPNLESWDLHGTYFEMIWDHLIRNTSSCYQNLTRLIVMKCAKLKYIFPSCVIKSFAQLRRLEISSCKELKEIVTKEEGTEAIATFTFPQVAFLELNDLPELTALCLGQHTSEWPMLKRLEVYKCDKLQLLTSDYEFNVDWEELLMRSDNLMIWQCLFLGHFSFKGTIEIKCDKSTNILLDILQRSIHIENLILSESLCKEIFSCGEKDKHAGTLMQIKNLELSKLSKLKCMWKQDSKLDVVLQNLGVLEVTDCDRLISLLPSHASFASLTVLEVGVCSGLTNLFVPSTAKSLVQLTEMKIAYCKLITEIISMEDDEDLRVEDEIVFNKLKLLSLEYLESLTCFCFGRYNFEFPVLEELIVNECPNMKTFSETDVSVPSLRKVEFIQDDNEEECWKGDLNTTIKHLHKNKVNSNSEELTLSGKDIMLVWQDPLPEHQFCQVKVLEVIRDESAHIPIEVLQRFKNLEKLILKVSSYQEIFSCEEAEKHVGMLTQIKELELWGLFDLKYMWKQDSHLDSIVQNLEMLNINFCHNLINLAPSSVTFENLTTLKVWQCHGLIDLVSSSTAKGLVRLEEMSIYNCEMMIEVVSNEEDKKNDDIVFEKLKTLNLIDLESLMSFCSGNYTFKFPTLEELVVDKCPAMKTFSEGVLSAPSLQKVKQYWLDREGYWEGDLNTTIQHRHKNLNIQISEKDSGQTSMKSPE